MLCGGSELEPAPMGSLLRKGTLMATRLAVVDRMIGAMLVIGVAVLLVPTAASAGTDPDAEYYRSVVTAIEPAVPGLEVVVHGGGDSVSLTNRTDRPVTVIGYSGEDYLRITRTGVEENINSLTAALNTDQGRVRLPNKLSSASKPLRPAWRTVSEANSFTWSDFRTRWSAEQRPPIVQADPQGQHQVFSWAMQLKVGKQPTLVRGTLTWTGAPRFGTTNRVLPAAFAAALLTFLALWLWRRSLRRRRPAGSHVRPRTRPAVVTPTGIEPRTAASTRIEPGAVASTEGHPDRVVLDRLPPEKAPPVKRFEKTIYPSVSARN
jgi:hypothetical protein